MKLLDVSEVSVRFGGITALDRMTFSLERDEICGLIGPNGAGKTSMFNVISRLYTPSGGSVTFDGADLLRLPARRVAAAGISRTFQNLALFPDLSVLENVMTGAFHRTRAGMLAAIAKLPRVGREERAVRAEATEVLELLGLGDALGRRIGELPFGTLKRVELGRALMARPRLLMLDEPANGLTHAEVDALKELLRRIRDDLSLSILLVEHHMPLVMGLSDRVVVMNFGTRIAEGSPAETQRDPAVIEAYLGGERAA